MFALYDVVNKLFQAIYAINGVTEAEQQLSGEEAFQGMDVNGDGMNGCLAILFFVEYRHKTVLII